MSEPDEQILRDVEALTERARRERETGQLEWPTVNAEAVVEYHRKQAAEMTREWREHHEKEEALCRRLLEEPWPAPSVKTVRLIMTAPLTTATGILGVAVATEDIKKGEFVYVKDGVPTA